MTSLPPGVIEAGAGPRAQETPVGIELKQPRSEAFQRVTYRAWKVGSLGTSYPIELRGVSTLGEAVSYGAPRCHHKEIFNVLETDEITGGKRLYVHAIKAGKPQWRFNKERGCDERIVPLKAVLLAAIDVMDFTPVQPFRWDPGCDVVGVPTGVVEVRS